MSLVNASRLCLVLLVLLSAAQQWRLIAQAPLAAPDAVEFVAVAQRIAADGLAATIRSETVPPLFPAMVCGVHATLTRAGLLDAAAWGRAAQLAAALGLIGAVVPVFLFSQRLVGRRAAVAAAILFCLLPTSSRLGTDGIADAWHLLFVAGALWMLVEANHTTGRPAQAWSLAAGLCVGLALLCRAEALVIGAAVGLTALYTLRTSSRESWRTAAAFAGGALVCLVPYLASGVVRPEAIAERLRGGGTATAERPLNSGAGASYVAATEADAAEVAPLIHDSRALEFGRKDRSRSSRAQSLTSATLLYGREFLQACGYVVLPLAAIGAFARRRRAAHVKPRNLAGPRLDLILALFTLLSYTFVVRQGYVTSRHFMLPLVILLPYAGLGLFAIGRAFRQRFASAQSAPQLARYVTLGLAAGCLLATLRPLHYTHAAHRDAADWLRSDAAQFGVVLDQYGWTALSTGRITYRFDAAEEALTCMMLSHVVVERIDLEAQSPRGESLRAVLGTAESATACFPDVRGRREHDVLVFQRAPDDAEALVVEQLRTLDPIPNPLLSAGRNPFHAR